MGTPLCGNTCTFVTLAILYDASGFLQRSLSYKRVCLPLEETLTDDITRSCTIGRRGCDYLRVFPVKAMNDIDQQLRAAWQMSVQSHAGNQRG